MRFSPSLISPQHTEYKGNQRSTIAGFSFPQWLASADEVEGRKGKKKNPRKIWDQFDMSKQNHYNSLSYLPREILHCSLWRPDREVHMQSALHSCSAWTTFQSLQKHPLISRALLCPVRSEASVLFASVLEWIMLSVKWLYRTTQSC